MAIAFRNSTTATKTTAANVTGTEPTGSADNDILIAFLFIESDTAITAPSGWSNTFNGTTMLMECNNASGACRMYAYWIRRSGVPALVWSHASAFRELVIVGYSGAITTGDPWSFGTSAVRDDLTANTYPAVSGTTAVANEMLIWGGGNFQGGTAGTPPTGFTERVDSNGNASDIEVAEKAQAAAGATGSITGASYTGSNSTTGVLFGGLKPPSAATGPANLKSYDTNVKSNGKSYNTNVIANVKSMNTNP